MLESKPLLTYSLNSDLTEAKMDIKGNQYQMQAEEVDGLIQQLGVLRLLMQPARLEEVDADSQRRSTLVREVHHRIKNNLQGVTGILRNFLIHHPELHDPIVNVISQVNSIAVIHGLQGRANYTKVRLCELIAAIASNIEALWQIPVVVDQPSAWAPCRIAEAEAVPLALVMNELISNAIKHGDKKHGISIKLSRKLPNVVSVSIINFGQLPEGFQYPYKLENGTGLQLIESLLPKKGINTSWDQTNKEVIVQLDIMPPVITDEAVKETPYYG